MKKQAQSPDLFLSGLEKDYYLHIWNLYKDGIENVRLNIYIYIYIDNNRNFSSETIFIIRNK